MQSQTRTRADTRREIILQRLEGRDLDAEVCQRVVVQVSMHPHEGRRVRHTRGPLMNEIRVRTTSSAPGTRR